MSVQEIYETPDAAANEENLQRVPLAFPLYSVILIALLTLVSLIQFWRDGTDSIIWGGEISTLFAGFVKPLFVGGQYWRILTGAVLHGGVVHLAFNCYALYVLGKLIETVSIRAQIFTVFLLAAVGGNILSLIFLPEGNSVGASGGILGFLGFLTVYGFKRRELLSPGFLKNMLFNVGFIAFTGIFVISNVDNFAHLGGFLAGAIYGWLQIPGDLYKDPREIGTTGKIFGYAAFGIVVLTVIYSILILTGVVPAAIPAEYFVA